MTTRFTRGDLVRSSESVQGLDAGRTYRVVEVSEEQTPFGNFVGYVLTESESAKYGERGWFVRNGHLLLQQVELGDVCVECDCGECEYTGTDCCDLRPWCETSSDGNVVVCKREFGCSVERSRR